MLKSATQHEISGLFNPENNIIYFIPKYQREYVWGKDDWEYLYNDIIDNDDGYFLGSILLINKSEDTIKLSKLEIVDGQQRMATISMLYSTIFDRINQLKLNSDEYIYEKLSLKNKLILKSDNQSTKIQLSYQNKNMNDYLYLLKECGLFENIRKPNYYGNRRISKAYQFFKEKIKDNNFEQLKELLRKINSTIVVSIEVETHSDAFMLFESLNNRGVPLTPIDIIKNKILAELEDKKILSVDKAHRIWSSIIENLPEYRDQERFLRQYYNAFKYDDNINVGIQRARRSNIIKIYEKLIKRNPEFLLNEILNKSHEYKKILYPDIENRYYEELFNLNNIGSTPGYLFLLYLFNNTNNHHEVKEILRFLEKYFVRRNLTDFPPTRDLDQIFINLIDECRNKGIKLNVVSEYLLQETHCSNIASFKQKLDSNIYEENYSITRYILTKIEEHNTKTKERYTNFWVRDKNNKYLWTVEHILPEGDNIPEEWIKMINAKSRDEAYKLHAKWVHKIGNLTLTAYNPNLSNANFVIKRNKKDKNGKYIGFKNGLMLNSVLENKNEWTIEDIRVRTQLLVEESLIIFKFENEFDW